MLETFEIAAKAVSDPNRTRILKLLEDGELCVCQITYVLELAPATVSKHLSILRAAGLVSQSKRGRWVYYALSGHSPLNEYAKPLLKLVAKSLDEDTQIKKDRKRLKKAAEVPLEELPRHPD